MKEVSRSSDDSDSDSSDNSCSIIRDNNRAVKKSGLDIFEFDEYDDDDGFEYATTIKTKITAAANNSWKDLFTPKLDPSPVKMDIDDDDDEADIPLSALRKKYRSSLGKTVGKNVGKRSDSKKQETGGEETKPIVTVALPKDNGNDDGQGTKTIIQYKKRLRVSKPEDIIKKQIDIEKPVKDQPSNKSSRKRQRVKNEGSAKKMTEEVKKEREVKGSGGTEKQILREKIKDMLLAADWTIDYRPRKGRAYMDSVYISPAGTGYWSIVKAYDAFQKEKEDASDEFTPLRDEVVGILTRQTQKKTEREMRNKRKYEGADDSDGSKEEKSGRKSRKTGRCRLLVRGSDKGSNVEDGFEAYSGKRTLLSWLVDSGVVHMNEDVKYMNRRKTGEMQKGSITKEGIQCGCCSEVVSVLKFEEHAGSKLRQPFVNIFLESGKSLMQCQIDAWNKLGELEKTGFYNVDVDGDDPNDDTCGVCGDGGDLICCDGCPSTFHQSCLDIEMLPQGDWHCLNCCCKYCDEKCTEVDGKAEASLLTCRLCQRKYHESCRPEVDDKPIESNNMSSSFCGIKCHELYGHLQKLVGVKHELDSGYSWSLIHRSDISTEASPVELSKRVECNSMLAVAMSVMDECFLPFTDRRSKINLIRNVVFTCGSNLSRLNYTGFYTAILEREHEVVCAASIRIHGKQLAEMPFIGTRHLYRRQGMCGRLLSAIESALSSLQVEKLIIPAIAEHMNTWTDIFGFHPLEESHKQELKSLNMVVFPGTDMLQKPLVKQDALDSLPEDIVKVDDIKDMSEKSELISSGGKDIGDESHNADSGSGGPAVPLDDSSVDTSKKMIPHNSPVKNHDIPCEPKLAISADAHIESTINESTVPEANKITPQLQLSATESVSANFQTYTNIEETNVHNGDSANLLPIQVDVHLATNVEENSVPTDDESKLVPTQVEVHSDTNVEETSLQNLDASNLLPTKVDVHPDTNIEETSVRTADRSNLLPTQVDVHPDTNVERDGVQTADGSNLPPSQVDVHANTKAEETSVQAGDGSNLLPTLVDVPSDTNVEETSLQNPYASNLLTTQIDVHPDTNVEGNGMQTADGSNLVPTQVDVHPNTKVEEISVQNGDGANLLPIQVDVHSDTNVGETSVPTDDESNLLPTQVDVHPDTNVEANGVQTGDGSNLLLSQVELHANTKVEETSLQTGDGSILLPSQVDVHSDTNGDVTSVQPVDGSNLLPTQVDVHSDAHVEEASLQNPDASILPTKMDVHLDTNVEETSVQTGGANLLPIQVDVHPATNVKETSVPTDDESNLVPTQVEVHSDTNVEETRTGDGSNLLPTQVVVHPDTNTDITSVQNTDTNVAEISVQPGDGSNLLPTKVDVHPVTDVEETGVQNTDVHPDTNVEETSVQTGDGSNLLPNQTDLYPDTNVEEASVNQTDVHSDINVEKTSLQTGDGSDLLLSNVDVHPESNSEETSVGKQTDLHLDTNVEESSVQIGDGSNLVPTRVDVHTNTDVEEATLQTGDRSNLLTTQVDVHTMEKADIQIGCETTKIPSNGTVSSELLCEREIESSKMESFSMESLRIEESSADIKPVIPETENYAEKEKVSLPAGKEGSCES